MRPLEGSVRSVSAIPAEREGRGSRLIRYTTSLCLWGAGLLLNGSLAHPVPLLISLIVILACASFWGAGPSLLVSILTLAIFGLNPLHKYVAGLPGGRMDVQRMGLFVLASLVIVLVNYRRSRFGQQMRRREKHYRVLVESTSDVMMILGSDGVIRYGSPSVLEVLGYEPRQLVGQPVWSLIHLEDAERAREAFEEAKSAAGLARPLDLRFRAKDGSYRALECVSNNQLGDPDVAAVIVSARDVTDRKRTAENFAALIELAPDAMVGVDDQGKIILVNSQTEQIFGYGRAELLGQSVEILVPESLRSQHLEHRSRYSSNPHPRPMALGGNLLARRKDGSEFSADISLSPMHTERGFMVASIIRDMTEHKKVEAQREELIREQAARAEAETAQRRYYDLVQNLDAIVWELDLKTALFSFVSNRAAPMLGYPLEHWLSAPDFLLTHVHPDDLNQMVSFIRQVTQSPQRANSGLVGDPARSRESSSTEYRAIAADGRTLWFRLIVDAPQGRSDQLRGLMVDINERKKAEDALRASEKLAVTARLAASLAHEINNPMGAVINLLYLIERQPQLDPESREWARLALREMGRVSHITRQMLGFYRDAVAPRLLQLTEVLDNTVQVYGRTLEEKGVKIVRRYQDGLPAVKGFPGEIHQVFSNLLLNAVEALPPGGCIILRAVGARDWQDPRVQGVRVTIADNGSGIPAQNLTRIFEPFFTTKQQNGTGLGLWVSHGIVVKHGGRIHVHSSTRSGRSGTAFSLFFPDESGQKRLGQAAGLSGNL